MHSSNAAVMTASLGSEETCRSDAFADFVPSLLSGPLGFGADEDIYAELMKS